MTRMTKIARRDPFAELHALADAAFGQRPGRRPANLFETRGLFPSPERAVRDRDRDRGIPVDLFETEEGIGLEFSLPGFSEDEISVTVADGVLAVAAERKSGPDESPGESDGGGGAAPERRYTRREISRVSLKRSFRIGEEYDPESATASLSNGVLELTLSRLPEAEPKQIPISVGPEA